MHESSMKNMEKFVKDYLVPKEKAADPTELPGVVLDIGSLDINGNYRELFDGWNYVGVDIMAGANVDLVLIDAYNWWMFSRECVEVIISGQCFEHLKNPEQIMQEIARVLKIDGVCCIIAPSGGDPDHGLRKFKVKDFEKLAKDAGLSVRSCYIDKKSEWKDCVLIVEKERYINGKVKFGKRPKED